MHTEIMTGGARNRMRTDRTDILFYGLILLTISLLYLFFFSDLPIYGDAWGYGYNCANWIADNGLQLIPSGTGRGETAGGHVAFYFWMWAAAMRVFGNTVKTAHLLPAVFSFLAIAGTYRLGRELAGRAMGVVCGIALLVSPLFLSQAFRPLPIAAVMAASVWSLFFYKREKYFLASLLCVFAVMMREQALMLSVTYIAVELYFFRDLRWRRIILFAAPFLVPVINAFSNFLVNGFVFLEINKPGIDQAFSLGLFLERLKFFAGYFFISHFRWIPVSVSAGILFARSMNKNAGLILGIILCSIGAFGGLQNYFTAILTLSLLYPVFFRKPLVSRMAMVLGLFPLLIVLFFTFIVFVTATDMEFMFFRYLAAAFPALIIGVIWTLFKSDRKFMLIAIVFIGATAATNFFVRFQVFYSDSNLAGYAEPLLVMRDAGIWAQEQKLTVIAAGGAVHHFSIPALGYTDSSLAVININSDSLLLERKDYVIVVPPLLPWGDDGEAALRHFTQRLSNEHRLELSRTITRGLFYASCYTLHWDPQVLE
ncbi:MAG: glycosyltransferase family 39 protein [Candidatus Aegiribacteria sp.]|nr:glycosyltransferase family 39 protein [Candidatus Aegiribacteria sp.]